SRTVKNHTPTRMGTMTTFDFVVIGDTEITEGTAYGDGTAQAGYKVVFNDNLNHVYAVEYVQPGASVVYGTTSVALDYGDGSTPKEITPPSYAFYNLTGYNKANETVEVTKDMVVTAQYETTMSEGEMLTINIYNASRDATTELEVPFAGKVHIVPEDLVETGRVARPNPGKVYINGEETELEKKAGVSIGGELYAMTFLEDVDFETWSAARSSYSEDAYNTEIPFRLDDASEYNFFPISDSVIVLYESDTDYEQAISDSFILQSARTTVKDELVLTNSKFTMYGKQWLPEGNSAIVSSGILMYLGNENITADDLTIANYANLSGAYRLGYTKSAQYGNINVSVNRANFAGRTLRVRYRTFVTYKTTEGGKTVQKTIYSDLADDTQQM
ncbi:MAG: hypothetical protein K6C14_02940, partial [Eubacterium sp.]|nr:hypothetical protein [Eubacterium sp.]